jgi:hypothetical protein
MVYFVGRDVEVWLGTEEQANGLFYSGSATGPNWDTGDYVTKALYTRFAIPCASGAASDTTYPMNFITGLDLSIGAMDDDITYLGFRDVTKVEIKKETTCTITRKKVDAVWDQVFNNARFGLTGSALIGSETLTEPTITRGYRIWIKLRDGDTVFTLRNSCVQSHTVSENADGTADETLEFMSYIDPKIATAAITAATDPGDL